MQSAINNNEHYNYKTIIWHGMVAIHTLEVLFWCEPQIHEKPEAVYILYSLCVILHGNKLMHMFNHRMLECD